MQAPHQAGRAGTPGFARKFLSDNWLPVLQVVVSQGAVIWTAAAGHWTTCAFFLVTLATGYWGLIERAAGVPEAPAKRREDMTPREAFWLDPSAVFSRERRNRSAA